MSVAPTRGPVQRPGEERDFRELFQRVGDHERGFKGRWVYVGSYPTTPDTTPDSPPFENGVTNAGGGLQRLRFRRTNEDQLEVDGNVLVPDGAVFPLVVTTLAYPVYLPNEAGYFVGASGESGALVWKYDTTGELSIVGFVTSGSDPDAIHWGSNTDPSGGGIELDSLGDLLMNLLAGAKIRVRNSTAVTILQIKEDGSGFIAGRMTPGGSWEVDDDDGAALLQILESGQFDIWLNDAGAVFTLRDSSGDPMLQMTEGGTYEFDLAAAQEFDVRDSGGNPLLQVLEDGSSGLLQQGTTYIQIDTTKIEAKLPTGGTFTLLNSSGNPILQMTEGSPDLHIPTGGNVIADL